MNFHWRDIETNGHPEERKIVWLHDGYPPVKLAKVTIDTDGAYIWTNPEGDVYYPTAKAWMPIDIPLMPELEIRREWKSR